ncbi:MAG: FtsQ-type POTRA domain-containing protein, partial [Butyricicoccus sp.]|nr:FtsQ-type POTRA domain-containing protein [Butyricicoccus sp.]
MSKKRARPQGQRTLPPANQPAVGQAPDGAPMQQPVQAERPAAKRRKKRRKIPVQQLSRSERQRRQVRRSFRRKMTRRLVFVLLTLGMAFLAVTIFFRVNTVDITGTAHYSAEDISKVLGVKKGDNLFTFRTNALEKKILKKYPYQSEVSVERQLPDALVVKATDAVPVIALDMQAGGYFLADANGKLLEQVAQIPEGVASVTGVILSDATPGHVLSEQDTDRAASLIALTKALAGQDMMADVDFINVSALYDVRFSYQGRLDVRLGETTQLREKLRMLARIVQDELSPSDVNIVYLSDPCLLYTSD